jgi:hypothetical protein
MAQGRAKLTEVNVGLNFGFLKVGGKWTADENQQKAAWELYVELVSRISYRELKPEEGLLREALSSLHSLFGTARDILRRYGPGVARLQPDSELSFGSLAVKVLNEVLHPFLSKWHPMLLEHEELKPPDVPKTKHERGWDKHDQLRQELELLRKGLVQYAKILAEIADVPEVVDG